MISLPKVSPSDFPLWPAWKHAMQGDSEKYFPQILRIFGLADSEKKSSKNTKSPKFGGGFHGNQNLHVLRVTTHILRLKIKMVMNIPSQNPQKKNTSMA